MRPDFGTGVFGLVFDNNDKVLAELLRLEVASAIGKFEPRAIVQDIRVDSLDSVVRVTINYVVLATRSQDFVQVSLNTGGGQ